MTKIPFSNYNPGNEVVQRQNRMVSDTYMSVVKMHIYYRDSRIREYSGEYGTVFEVAPNTFFKIFESEESVIEETEAFIKIYEIIPPTKVREFQCPETLGYFKFESENRWYFVFGFRFGMKGETNAFAMDGTIVNPKKYAESIGIDFHGVSELTSSVKEAVSKNT